MNIKWSVEETNFLKENRDTMTIKELSVALNKTEKSVKRKLEREKIYKGGRQEWTEEDQKKLVDNIDKYFKDIVELFPEKKLNTIKKKYYEYRSGNNN